jgi:hypothetical protein
LTVQIPDDLAQAINQTVTGHLGTEFASRGLLLPATDFEEAANEAADTGARLLEPVIHQCYPLSQYDSQVVSVEFDNDGEASRVCAALAFGAATAALFGSPDGEPDRQSRSVELLSAIFNLGVGLIDGVCDEDGQTGQRLLDLIECGHVSKAARHERPRGWLRARLSADLEFHAAASFAVDIVETFFAVLHAVFPNVRGSRLREKVGDELTIALRAEQSSLTATLADTARETLENYSRATSVLPFQIVATLARGDYSSAEPSAGTLVGQAMWRIDDLVDLCDDAETGALNAVLLDAIAATPDQGSGDRHRLSALESLLGSGRIASAAAQAAENLARGIRLAGHGRLGTRDQRMFLHFTQRYAGVAPRS